MFSLHARACSFCSLLLTRELYTLLWFRERICDLGGGISFDRCTTWVGKIFGPRLLANGTGLAPQMLVSRFPMQKVLGGQAATSSGDRCTYAGTVHQSAEVAGAL